MTVARSFPAIVIVLLIVSLLLGCAYVAGYFMLLDPVEMRSSFSPEIDVIYRLEYYNAGSHSGLAEGFFRPIHRVDRFIRYRYWHEDVSPSPQVSIRREGSKKCAACSSGTRGDQRVLT